MPNADPESPLLCALCHERPGTQLATVPSNHPDVQRIIHAFRALGREPEIVAGMLEVVCNSCGAIIDAAWRDDFKARNSPPGPRMIK